MVNIFVAVTDNDWFRFLAAEPDLDEANFWQPGGRTEFRALKPGELFLFKLHSPHNFIVGGGIFAYASILPISLAWEAFGRRNGIASFGDMQTRIARYRREPDAQLRDYQIGCRIIEEPFFFPCNQRIPIPPSWSSNIVVGKKYDAEEEDGRYIWESLHEGLGALDPIEAVTQVARFGAPSVIHLRLGQGAFRVIVTDA